MHDRFQKGRITVRQIEISVPVAVTSNSVRKLVQFENKSTQKRHGYEQAEVE
jgi:hypothetical protein